MQQFNNILGAGEQDTISQCVIQILGLELVGMAVARHLMRDAPGSFTLRSVAKLSAAYVREASKRRLFETTRSEHFVHRVNYKRY